ncbi:hypothetical protein ACFPRL_32190 [Pseudoclavibacter helvolus]
MSAYPASSIVNALWQWGQVISCMERSPSSRGSGQNGRTVEGTLRSCPQPRRVSGPRWAPRDHSGTVHLTCIRSSTKSRTVACAPRHTLKVWRRCAVREVPPRDRSDAAPRG